MVPTPFAQEPADDGAEAAEAGEDHVAGSSIAVRLASGAHARPDARQEHALVQEDQERRRGHREGHRRHQRVRRLRAEHGLLQGERQEHEGELPALREGEGEKQVLVGAHAEGAAEHEEDRRLGREDEEHEAGERAGWAATSRSRSRRRPR